MIGICVLSGRPDRDATRLNREACRSSQGVAVPRVLVDVVLKPEILDPQGQAIVGALGRLGVQGVTDVRQGKHFELEVDDTVDEETIVKLADTLLANPVIENFTIRR
jgi:phosphoribosylformylglycinamidine synthase PurS subunit